jgi:YbbR domain-containing protein
MRDWFIRDFGWKLLSLLLALAIWLTVSRIRSESETSSPISISESLMFTNVPVLIVSSAADVRDFHVKPSEVTVTVRGSPEEIASLQASQVRAFVDLTGLASAPKLRRHVDVSMPSGIALVRVEPLDVDVVVPPPRQ